MHNRRKILKTVVSKQGDGAYAVVDVDTLWRDRQGKDFHWKGRACKGYTKVGGEWKLIFHTGLLEYGCSTSRPNESLPERKLPCDGSP